jgi:hypothetical protein
MIVFIDESGDSGFKLDKGSSTFFIISMVIFETEEDAKKTSKLISDFRKLNKLSPSYEFKFNKNKKKLIVKFLEYMKNAPFSIRCLIIDKNNFILSKNVGRNYYQFFLKMFLTHNIDIMNKTLIKLDESHRKNLQRSLNAELRKTLNKNKKSFSKISFSDSRSNDLIQLADIIVGSIGRDLLTTKNDSSLYKDLIKSKIIEEWHPRRNSI